MLTMARKRGQELASSATCICDSECAPVSSPRFTYNGVGVQVKRQCRWSGSSWACTQPPNRSSKPPSKTLPSCFSRWDSTTRGQLSYAVSQRSTWHGTGGTLASCTASASTATTPTESSASRNGPRWVLGKSSLWKGLLGFTLFKRGRELGKNT